MAFHLVYWQTLPDQSKQQQTENWHLLLQHIKPIQYWSNDFHLKKEDMIALLRYDCNFVLSIRILERSEIIYGTIDVTLQ